MSMYNIMFLICIIYMYDAYYVFACITASVVFGIAVVMVVILLIMLKKINKR